MITVSVLTMGTLVTDYCGDCVECVDYGDMSSYEVSEPYDLVSSPSSTALSLHL